MKTPAWIPRLFAAIDAMDADGFATFLTDDAEFRYANAPPVIGSRAIRDAVAGFFGTIGGLNHRLVRIWTHPDSVICQLEVSYTRKDGKQVTIPAATIFYLEGERIRTYLIYNDLAPVYAAA